MRIILCLLVVVLAGCSARKEHKSGYYSDDQNARPELRQFKEAARSFVAACRIVSSAKERWSHKDDIDRYCKLACDAYVAIPPGFDEPSRQIVEDAMCMNVHLRIGYLANLSCIRGMTDALEAKLDRLR